MKSYILAILITPLAIIAGTIALAAAVGGVLGSIFAVAWVVDTYGPIGHLLWFPLLMILCAPIAIGFVAEHRNKTA